MFCFFSPEFTASISSGLRNVHLDFKNHAPKPKNTCEEHMHCQNRRPVFLVELQKPSEGGTKKQSFLCDSPPRPLHKHLISFHALRKLNSTRLLQSIAPHLTTAMFLEDSHQCLTLFMMWGCSTGWPDGEDFSQGEAVSDQFPTPDFQL